MPLVTLTTDLPSYKSGEKRVLRHAELPAGFDKVRNVFHLFEGHLGLVDAPDRIRGNGVDSIAQDDTDS